MHWSLRDWNHAVLLVLGVLCATYWFGNSGAGFALLWWESRRGAGRFEAPPDDSWLATLEEDELVFAHVGSLRIVVVGAQSGRHEVFRDELTDVAWTRLRRRCVGLAQVQASSGRG